MCHTCGQHLIFILTCMHWFNCPGEYMVATILVGTLFITFVLLSSSSTPPFSLLLPPPPPFSLLLPLILPFLFPYSPSLPYLYPSLTSFSPTPSPHTHTPHSNNNLQAISCSNHATNGYLYPLDKGFIFVHKPTIYIKFEGIASVNFARMTGGAGVSRSFDFDIELKDGIIHHFSSMMK